MDKSRNSIENKNCLRGYERPRALRHKSTKSVRLREWLVLWDVHVSCVRRIATCENCYSVFILRFHIPPARGNPISDQKKGSKTLKFARTCIYELDIQRFMKQTFKNVLKIAHTSKTFKIVGTHVLWSSNNPSVYVVHGSALRTHTIELRSRSRRSSLILCVPMYCLTYVTVLLTSTASISAWALCDRREVNALALCRVRLKFIVDSWACLLSVSLAGFLLYWSQLYNFRWLFVRGGFFFVSRLLGVVYAAGSKKNKKNTLNTRGCSFEYHWTREGAWHARHTVDSNV